MNKKDLAATILHLVGGEHNVAALTHCATRLRFNIKDDKKVDKKKLEATEGIMGVVTSSAQLQIIIGTEVHDVCEEIYKQTQLMPGSDDVKDSKKVNIFMRALAIIPRVFTPILPAIMAGGLLKALFAILQLTGILDAASTTYQILNFASDVSFYFLPILIAVSASNVFKTNTYLSVAVVAVLLHPSWTGMIDAKEAVSLFGITVPLVSYASTMIPAILGIWIMSYVERFFNKYVPEALKYVFAPLLTFLVMLCLMFIIIGPIGFYCGTYVSMALMSIYDVAGWLAIVLIAAFKPLLVMTGMHYALTTAFLTMFTATGVDKFYMSASILANLAQSGATFGVFLKSKNKKMKSIALSTSFTALMGITEPALFGVTLKYKKTFISAMIGAAVGALYAALAGVQFITMAGVGILGLLGVIPQFMIHMIIAAIITLVVSAGLTIVWGYRDDMELVALEKKEEHTGNEMKIENNGRIVKSPLKGKVIDLCMVKDEAFAHEVIGKGAAILPEDGHVYAPVSGKVSALFSTNHAIGITTDKHDEVLIHIGMDTVNLNGKYFHPHVKQGDEIQEGDLILEFDLDKIIEEGYDITTPIVITNKDDYMDIFAINKQEKIKEKDELLAIIDK